MITYTHKNVNIGKAKAQRWTRESDVGHDPVWRTGDKWTDEALSHHHVIHTVLVLRHFVQKYSRSFLFYPFTCFFLSWLVCLYSIGAIVIEATEIRPDIARPYCHEIVIQLPHEPSPIGLRIPRCAANRPRTYTIADVQDSDICKDASGH